MLTNSIYEGIKVALIRQQKNNINKQNYVGDLLQIAIL
jgi:hypothetical protein